MRTWLILALCIFAVQAATELWPSLLPTPDPVIEPVEQAEPFELNPEPVKRVPQRSGTRWMGGA